MNERKLLSMPVAILGGGACAQTFAADLALTGFETRLFDFPEFAPRMLGKVMQDKRIQLDGAQANFKWFRRTGTATLALVTTDIARALRGAGLVILAIPAKGHKQFFDAMIPHLENGQVVSLFPGNFGALMLRRMMRAKRCRAKVVVGGWSSMPYGVRMVEPGKLDLSLRTRTLVCDTLPSRDGGPFIEVMRRLPVFDGAMELARGDTVIGVDLSNPNPVVHVPGSLLSVGPMEVSEMEGILGIAKGAFSMYKHGMSPAVCRVQYAFYREERAIAKALGVKMVEYEKEQFFSKSGVMGIEYRVPFTEVVLPPIAGPDSVEHRYFTEDIAVGTVVRFHLAKILGVETPVIESLIRLGSIVCGKDFFEEGPSPKQLGIESMDPDKLLALIR
ncbi:MAG: NAD/NADP octopine/nopaline dehydrogenase family protein [Planctomycetota bacterium]